MTQSLPSEVLLAWLKSTPPGTAWGSTCCLALLTMSVSRDCRDVFCSGDVVLSCIAARMAGITVDIGNDSSSPLSASFSSWAELRGDNREVGDWDWNKTPPFVSISSTGRDGRDWRELSEAWNESEGEAGRVESILGEKEDWAREDSGFFKVSPRVPRDLTGVLRDVNIVSSLLADSLARRVWNEEGLNPFSTEEVASLLGKLTNQEQ